MESDSRMFLKQPGTISVRHTLVVALRFPIFNHDGLADIAIQQLDTPLILLKNNTHTANRLVSIRLIGRESNRSGIGARVEIRTDQRRFLQTRMGSSQLSLIGCG